MPHLPGMCAAVRIVKHQRKKYLRSGAYRYKKYLWQGRIPLQYSSAVEAERPRPRNLRPSSVRKVPEWLLEHVGQNSKAACRATLRPRTGKARSTRQRPRRQNGRLLRLVGLNRSSELRTRPRVNWKNPTPEDWLRGNSWARHGSKITRPIPEGFEGAARRLASPLGSCQGAGPCAEPA